LLRRGRGIDRRLPIWWPVSDSLRPIHTTFLFTTPHFFPMTTPHLNRTTLLLNWRERRRGAATPHLFSCNSKKVWCELGEGCHLRATIRLHGHVGCMFVTLTAEVTSGRSHCHCHTAKSL